MESAIKQKLRPLITIHHGKLNDFDKKVKKGNPFQLGV